MIEVIAFRVGTAKLKKLGIHHGMLGPFRPLPSIPFPPLPRQYAHLILFPIVL